MSYYEFTCFYFAYGKLPPVVKKFLDLGRHGILVWFSILMIKYGAKITALNIAKKQPATQLSQGLLFAPLVVGGILMAVYAAFNFASVCLKPLSEYVVDKNAVKTIDEMNKREEIQEASRIRQILHVDTFRLSRVAAIPHPISFCLGVSALFTATYLGIPFFNLFQKMSTGITSFTFMCVPFFLASRS
ncbi:TRAP transporter small permease subunit [Treponema parvum]|uniref:TRAP transporter small permease subunit n=1 Tax=Treponema parvum TaxID=138851 RepID=UPI00211DB3C7|nr:TRAP transporter small permease subunit [Treponema parvum]